jgi:hypothetical protein
MVVIMNMDMNMDMGRDGQYYFFQSEQITDQLIDTLTCMAAA